MNKDMFDAECETVELVCDNDVMDSMVDRTERCLNKLLKIFYLNNNRIMAK